MTMPASSKKLIIFDWDGTLSDSVSRIARCIQLSASDHLLPAPSFDQAKDIIGLGLREAILQLFPHATDDLVSAFAMTYSAHYRQQDNSPCEFFPQVLDTLTLLRQRNYLLAVATGKSRAGLDRVLTATNLTTMFHGSRCADETASKPDPLMLQELCEEFGIRPDEAIMVGDTEYDLEMARRIAMPSVGVSYGAHAVERLTRWQPLQVIDAFAELDGVLTRHCGFRPGEANS